MNTHKIDFQPSGRRGESREKETILDCARRLQIGISSTCGSSGTCGQCRIKIIRGTVSAPTAQEKETFSAAELAQGWRLACQTYPKRDLEINIPPESMTIAQRTQTEGQEIAVQPEPIVAGYRVKLTAATLTHPAADDVRLITTLNKQHDLNCQQIDFTILRRIASVLRENNSEVIAIVRGDEVIAVTSPGKRLIGLAIDLGTTKIAGYLVDLANGKTLAVQGIMNPQISYGEDIISRITAAMNSQEQSKELQRIVVAAINRMAQELCHAAHITVEEIVDAVIVGNTAMHHLLLNLPVARLAVYPYVPAVSQPLDIKAGEIGLNISPGAYLHILPNIAGFVGADHVAMLLATDAWQEEGPVLALDIGTNTEVSLIHKGKIISASCASGPAFEGGHIKDGMRAANGAIERLRINGEKVEYQTVNNAPPAGICGSGILDAAAQLLINGVIDNGGRMKEKKHGVRQNDTGLEFILAHGEGENQNIVFTQQDVRQIQLGKAAIRTGIQLLLEKGNIQEEEIKKVIIAGAFGSYLDISSAITIGMLPVLPLDRFYQVGNAAGTGARRALISRSERAKAQQIAEQVQYVELGAQPNFNQTFTQTLNLGRYRLKQGKREDLS